MMSVASSSGSNLNTDRAIVIDLSHQCIGPNEVSQWSLSVDLSQQAQYPGQITVRLGFNNLGDLGAQYVGKFLKDDNAIGSLDLSFNDIDDAGIQKLCESLTFNSTLRVLHLSGNRITANGFKYIAYALQSNSALESLHATGNSAGPDGCYAIAEAMCVNQTLRTLCLSGNKIGSAGCAHLSAALGHSYALRELVLSDNQLGDDGIQELSLALQHHRQLESLDVSFNGITSIGAEALCGSLAGYTNLAKLLLDNNKLRDAGAKTVAKVLPSMRLRVLNIGFNEIEADGVAAVLLAIVPNETLTTLSLSGNTLSNDVSLVMANVLKQDRVLTSLNLDHINIGSVGERNVAVGIATNVFSALQCLTGFHLGQVLVQLGSPPTLSDMPNDQALRYLHSMWQMHLGAGHGFHPHSQAASATPLTPGLALPARVSESNGGTSSPIPNPSSPFVVRPAPAMARSASAERHLDAAVGAELADATGPAQSQSLYGPRGSGGVSVTAVSSLLDSIDFIGSKRGINSSKVGTPSSPTPVGSSSTVVRPSDILPALVVPPSSPGALARNRNSSFACAEALSSAMMEFDRLYREIEGDDLFDMELASAPDPSVLVFDKVGDGGTNNSGHPKGASTIAKGLSSSLPSHTGSGSGGDSNDNDMTDDAEDGADTEHGAVWSHALDLRMQRTPDIMHQVSDNVKEMLSQIAAQPFVPMDLWELHQYYFSPPVGTPAPAGGLFARSRASSTSSIDSLVDRPTAHRSDDPPASTHMATEQGSHMEASDSSVSASMGAAVQSYSSSSELGLLGSSAAGGAGRMTPSEPGPDNASPRGRDLLSTTTHSSATSHATTRASVASHTKRKHSSGAPSRYPSYAAAVAGSSALQQLPENESWPGTMLPTTPLSAQQSAPREAVMSGTSERAQLEPRPWKRAGTRATMARIHYYPRLAHALDQMKASADEARSLTLLRQLRYLEHEFADGNADSRAVDVETLLLAGEMTASTESP